MLKESNIKELGTKVSENQKYLEAIGISNEEIKKHDQNRSKHLLLVLILGVDIA